MNILIIGAFVGWVASQVLGKDRQHGLLKNYSNAMKKCSMIRKSAGLR